MESERTVMWGFAGQAGMFCVIKPYDEQEATVGNGTMFGFAPTATSRSTGSTPTRWPTAAATRGLRGRARSSSTAPTSAIRRATSWCVHFRPDWAMTAASLERIRSTSATRAARCAARVPAPTSGRCSGTGLRARHAATAPTAVSSRASASPRTGPDGKCTRLGAEVVVCIDGSLTLIQDIDGEPRANDR
jgi:hypothetical protein